MTSNGSTIRVAVVEDLTDYRENLVRLLSAAEGFCCVGACRSTNEALQVLPSLNPAIVLTDIRMPGLSGIDCVRLLKPKLPRAQFMMLTVLEDHDLIFRSLQAGATGYLLKKTPSDRLLEAIKELHAGGAPISAQIARKIVAHFQKTPPETADKKLSPMEGIVLTKLGRGRLYKEVADELQVSISTIRTHVHSIYQKLHVHNRTEAIRKGLSLHPPVGDEERC